jgi:UDP-N-acetylmuramoylalanine--D-glutamate ligase
MPLVTPDFLKPALARPVAILGGGVSGEGVRALLTALGASDRVYDLSAARGAEFTVDGAAQHGLLVFSPGFAPEHPWLRRAREAGALCLGELDFGSLFWRGRLVAITGTNGKTTLTEFLVLALHTSGAEAYAAGTNGHPLSRLAAEHDGGARDAIAVCEVSSFQAETLEHFRADATLWTNFAEDHLERHPGLAAYFMAKWQLVAHTLCGSLAEAVRRAADFADAGDQVVLSPGFASFDMFRSYADRGETFVQAVERLAGAEDRAGGVGR